MQNKPSIVPFLLIVNMLFSINSNAQSINLNDSLQIGQSIKKGLLRSVKKIEENRAFMPYIDTLIGKTLISGFTIKEGRIVSEGMLQATGSTSFTLSNGIKVHYKLVEKNKNDVQLKAISYGGYSLVEDSDLASAQVLANVISLSGLGNYSATDLSKILAGKTAKTNIHLSNLTEEINGASTTKDVETLLQMIHLRFVKPRFDKEAYQVLIGNLKNDRTATPYGNNHLKRRLINYNFVKDVSLDKIRALYTERFGNAADFEFFIVGDIQKGKLRPLLEKYMASIPTNDVKESRQDNSALRLQETVVKNDVSLIIGNPKNVVRMSYKNNIPYSLKNKLIAKILNNILQLRLTEVLGEKEKGSCNRCVKVSMSKYPTEQASLQITSDCNLDHVNEFVTMVHKELENISRGVAAQIDLERVKANYLKERKEQRHYNSYDMRLLINYFREDYNMNNPKNFENLVNTITIEDIETFTKGLIKDSKSYETVSMEIEKE